MTFTQLKEHCEIFSPVFLLEKSLSYRVRRKIRSLSSLLIFIFLILVSGIFVVTDEKVLGFFFITLFFWMIFLMFDAFYYSYYFRGDTSILSEKGFLPAGASFEIASIVFGSDEDDITKGFLRSEYGRLLFSRCGISPRSVSSFLSSRMKIITAKDIVVPDNTITLGSYAEAIFSQDEELAKFLLENNISRSDFAGASDWVVRIFYESKRRERWWGRDVLGRIKGIGKDWSYGKAFTLEKYSKDIRDTSHFASVNIEIPFRNKEVSSLETILSRSFEANALIVAEKGSGALDMIARLARKINDGSVLFPLEHKCIKIIDTNALIAINGNKNSFEREILEIFSQSIKARNIILVIEDLPAFMLSARNMGSDPVSLLAPFLTSPYLQLIAISDPMSFNRFIESSSELMQLFEKIQLSSNGGAELIDLIEDKAVEIEAKNNLMFTYPAISAIVSGAERYFVGRVMPDKAIDLLVELVPMAKKEGKRIIHKEDVLFLIGSKTGVPTGEVDLNEREKLINIESVLHKRVIGQDEAITAISNAMRRSRSGISNPNRPIGSFLFLGPTGVGKTETAKALAQVFFGDENKMIRLDMSEYNTKEGLERLIGSFNSGAPGTLVSMLREEPYGVLLLDEFEKTNKDVLDLFLQVLDEGIFSDMLGKKVNVRNHIIIATSNAGSDIIWNMVKASQNLVDNKGGIIDQIISRGIFKPELLNRFDGTILFHPLDIPALRQIATLMLKKLQKRLSEQGIILEITDDLVSYLVKEGNDPQFGARPLNRAIQEKIEKIIADKIIQGKARAGTEINITSAELA